MSLDIRWLVPAAIFAAAPQCMAAKYMNVEQARALIFPSADEYVAKPVQLTAAQMQEIEKLSGVPGRTPQLHLWQARSNGRMIGWLERQPTARSSPMCSRAFLRSQRRRCWRFGSH